MATQARLPEFIIAGSPRSGTTWLCHLLASHPQVGLAQPIAPEPKFFLVDDLYARGMDYYASRWFSDIDRDIVGEKSTNYLESPQCAERIAQNLPNVKLIFMFRHPAERAFSNYRWSRQNGHEAEEFASALAIEGQRETPQALRYARPFDYLRRGRYADLLRPYLARFSRKQLLFLSFEQAVEAPESVALQLHHFLNIEPRPHDSTGIDAVNRSETGELDNQVRQYLLKYYAAANRELQHLTGFDTSRWAS